MTCYMCDINRSKHVLEKLKIASGKPGKHMEFHSDILLSTLYDRTTPLETHLAKLDICADYYGWIAHDRLCHLKVSLDGHAGQVL